MSRRRAPRQAASAFQAARDLAAPKTGLATIQSAWSQAVGPQLAAVASPVSERAGTLTIEVTDSVWAQELDLMQGTILEHLREALGESAPQSLKFRLASDTFT
jgi:predicted nucleic acid-binding Zn ribbon protein